MNQSKFDHFLTGIFVSFGLTVLVKTRGSEEKKEKLKQSWQELESSFENIDLKETKKLFLSKLKKIEAELKSFDHKETQELISKNNKIIKEKWEEIIQESRRQDLPKLENFIKEMQEKSTILLEELNTKIQDEEKM